MNKIEIKTEIRILYGSIAELINQAKIKVAITVNAEVALLNWMIGVYINQFVLKVTEHLTANRSSSICLIFYLKILDPVGLENS